MLRPLVIHLGRTGYTLLLAGELGDRRERMRNVAQFCSTED
jgi:hypothetical protein